MVECNAFAGCRKTVGCCGLFSKCAYGKGTVPFTLLFVLNISAACVITFSYFNFVEEFRAAANAALELDIEALFTQAIQTILVLGVVWSSVLLGCWMNFGSVHDSKRWLRFTCLFFGAFGAAMAYSMYNQYVAFNAAGDICDTPSAEIVVFCEGGEAAALWLGIGEASYLFIMFCYVSLTCYRIRKIKKIVEDSADGFNPSTAEKQALEEHV